MKSKKGITLIALIITIIVMLILVGVTITVAIQGGLFDTARNAKVETQKEMDKEILTSAVVSTVNNYGNVNLEELVLPEGFTYDSTTKVYKSKTGNEFTIDETTGKVEEKTNSTEAVSFKLGDLSTVGMTYGSGGAQFSIAELEKKFGEGFFTNPKYFINMGELGQPFLTTDNNEIVDLGSVHFGLADDSNKIYGFSCYTSYSGSGDKFIFIVQGASNHQILSSVKNHEYNKTWEEFIALYPDTVFTFCDTTNISLGQ